MPFISKLKIHSIRSTNKYRVITSLDYQCATHLIRVPAGFITDFASIPALLRWYINDHGPGIRDAAVVHDFLYSKKSGIHYGYVNRYDADMLLLKGMNDLGASWFKREIVFWAVRLFGKYHYRID